MALARATEVSFTYPEGDEPALDSVSLELDPGEAVALLGPSGSGKSTLLRALSGLVPHFHGGRFAGQVEIAGRDTRLERPAEFAGLVATLFQDPEDQVVLDRVEHEVTFGLENLGTLPAEILPRAHAALAVVGAQHLASRRIETLSAGELQRVCLASAFALEPQLVLLDEPTSQLDPEGAEAILDLALGSGAAVVISEQRPSLPLERCERVVFMERGRLLLDAPREEALEWLLENRPAYLPRQPAQPWGDMAGGETLCRVDRATFSYGDRPVLDGASLKLRRGEIVALTGPNGIGKTTLAKLVAGLLEPDSGRVQRVGRASYLSQDPGRYLIRERADEEVALSVGGDLAGARRSLAEVGLAGLEHRHPRDLSSGERERLALAAVLVTEPDVLVLDEPTRGIDPLRKEELANLLRQDSDRRATLVVTHDLVFAGDVADRLVPLGVREAALA
ncbi:MAG: ATP-binding cassette domain-containing protein [Actinobacteria bacterium]|nr:ATP-binding cassette domain-containing protein [Actinomycetota bacterium]